MVVSFTAGSALDAMDSLRDGLGHRPFVLDVNSVPPAAKQEAAGIIGAAGGRYAEAAVMTSVPPKGLALPCCSAGPARRRSWATVAPLGMDLPDCASDIGRA